MPRTTDSQGETPGRNRSRGPARSSSSLRSISQPGEAADRRAPAEAAYSPTYDEIAEAAYLRYLRRGGGDGQDFDDWVEAERELRFRRQAS